MSTHIARGYQNGMIIFPENGPYEPARFSPTADIDLKTFEPSQPAGKMGSSFPAQIPVPQSGQATMKVSEPILQQVPVPVAVPTFDFKTAAIAVVVAFLAFKYLKKRK